MPGTGTLYAISDLHVGYQENKDLVNTIVPPSDQDWLIVAGDVAEVFDEVTGTLARLREKFAKVIWAPGNHELWTIPSDRVQLRGEERYQALVEACREIDVLTPEDDFAVFDGPAGPVAIVPLFIGYDYSFLAPGTSTEQESLAKAYEEGIVCADERFLHPDPYPGRRQWCHARVELTEKRLSTLDPAVPTVLVNHYPLRREPTRIMHYQVFTQWCGTELTADWHLRFRAAACIYGHLHIPRKTSYDGIRFEEVSLGYPREWKARPTPPRLLCPVFPEA